MKERILVVNDCLESLLLLKELLTKSGYSNVTWAHSSEETLLLLQHSKVENGVCPIDLILLEIVMNGRDGIETCSLIKENVELTDIPIIMTTKMKDSKLLDQAFLAGATDFFTRPYNQIEFKARIRSSLLLKKEMDKRRVREDEILKVAEELKKANKLFRKLSMIDGLTEIANRRRFDETVKSEWARSFRNGTPFSIVLLDIDKFKLYNDNYGHLQGDECLKQVASIIERTANRVTDMVARYGGEEFVIILPETDFDGAKAVAELVRKNIENAQIPHITSPVKDVVTISIGVASVYPKTEICTLKEFINSADMQLYEAKNKGRNQVRSKMIEIADKTLYRSCNRWNKQA